MRRIISIILTMLLALNTAWAVQKVVTDRNVTAEYPLASAEAIKARGIAVTHTGRIWLSSERQLPGDRRAVVISYADAAEGPWTDVAVIPGVEGGLLWIAPNGGLQIYYMQDGMIYSSACPNSTDAAPVWMPPATVGEGVVSGAPVFCPDRRLALPVQTADGPAIYISADLGMSWTPSGGPRDIPEAVKAYNNPHLYVTPAKELAMVCGSHGTAYSYVSKTNDRGQSWSASKRFSYNADKNFALTSLSPGNVLMVKNNRIDHRAYAYAKGLYAYLTIEDGTYWHGGLRLDAREDVLDPVVAVSKGVIYIAYTRNVRGENEIDLVVTSELEIAQAWGLLESDPKVKVVVMKAGASGEAFKKKLDAARNAGQKQDWAKKNIRVASYNIQWHGYVKKPTWEQRLVAVEKIFSDYDFDIVGMQEPDTMMANTIEKALGGKYKWVGVVRSSSKTSAGFIPLNPIFYKVDRLELLEQDIFWFGHAPDEVGYDSWGMRLCNYAKFRDKHTGKVFYMFNSHYDHRGHEAKEYSSVVLLNKIMEVASGYPVVLTGDFNTDEKTPGYQRLIESGIVDDAMLALPAGKRENWEYFSMSNYKPIETIRKNNLHIDHVFYTPSNSKVITWKLILDSCDGIFGSDHLPIVIDWKIAN